MLKYGLRPGTLKGELFKILLEQGNNGLKVSQIAKMSQVTLFIYLFIFLTIFTLSGDGSLLLFIMLQ